MRLPRGRVLVAPAVAAAVPLLLAASSLADTRAAPVTVTVTARDYSFKLSAKAATVGKVTFAVTNTGAKAHSFQIAGRKTAVLKPGASAKLVVSFTKAGPFAYTSTVAGDAAKGMRGTFTAKAAPAEVSAAGKDVFVARCGACHTLAAAGTTGSVGPNLDHSTASLNVILNVVASGKGTMEAVSSVTPEQLKDVANFVVAARGG